MTDTPSPGAGADARVHGPPAALALLDIHHLAAPRPLSPAEADAAFQPRSQVLELSTTVIDASPLKPQLLALVRWLIHGLGIWLIAHGLGEAQEAAAEPILTGIALSSGALAWSILQKNMAAQRLHAAAAAEPAQVVLR